MNFFYIVIAVTLIFFAKRAFLGPQKKFASVFLLLTSIGIIALMFSEQNSVFIYISGVFLLIAPIVGIIMLVISMSHAHQINK
jgi:amino acid transporter